MGLFDWFFRTGDSSCVICHYEIGGGTISLNGVSICDKCKRKIIELAQIELKLGLADKEKP